MINDESPRVKVKARTHYFQNRDFELAAKVQRLPNTALVDSREIAALTGIAATSFAKPSQRKQMGLPAPIRIGRLLKWRMADIGKWLGEVPAAAQVPAPRASGLSRRGRPTKSDQLARVAAQEAKAQASVQ